MDIAEPLLAAHRARFAAVDALLPPAAPPAHGERLDAATADGTQVTGVLQRQRFAPGDVPMLWSAADTWQLFPYFGATGTEGADLLLRALKGRLETEETGDDSACVVVWPSRDAEAIRAFLDHGLVPLSAVGVRTAPPPEADPAVTVRRAGPSDYAAAVALAEATFDYTGLVASPRRPTPPSCSVRACARPSPRPNRPSGWPNRTAKRVRSRTARGWTRRRGTRPPNCSRRAAGAT